MSEFSKPAHSDFLLECQRLHRAQLDAKTPDDLDAANAAMQHFLMMNGAGRLQEYFANRQDGQA